MSRLGRFILPYHLEKVKDTQDQYVVVQRDYKPLGFNTARPEAYGDYPISHRLSITPKMAAKLSCCGDPNTDDIYLYNDGTNPLDSQLNMAKYLERLNLLARLEVKRTKTRPIKVAKFQSLTIPIVKKNI
jgi:hypothetical protein